MGAGPGELYGASPVRALTPFIRSLLHGLITAKAPTPNTTILAIGIPTYEFGGHPNFQPRACGKRNVDSYLPFTGKETDWGRQCDLLRFLFCKVTKLEFKPKFRVLSYAEWSGIIQGRKIQNLFFSPEKIKIRDVCKMKGKEQISTGGRRDNRSIYIFTGQMHKKSSH